MASLSDASGNRTLFAYDLKGRLLTETDPLGKVKTYTYDEDGNLVSSVNRRGQTIEYVYDQVKRRIRKETPERTIAYGYNLVDQLTSIGSIYLSYDPVGRLSTYYDPSASFRFSYDAAGNLTGVSDNSSSQQSRAYAYDVLNRVMKITAGSEVFQFTYDAVGRRGTVTYPNGMSATYAYSPRGELRDLQYTKDGQSLSRFQYEYDAVGRRTALTDSYGRHEFAYDEAGQVTAARWQQMGKEHFGYDASGNILFNREYDFTYGAGNRLLGDTCGRLSYTYDDDGNVTSKITPDGTTQYQWDSENRLIGITKPDGTAIAYQYDELGRRVGKQIGWQQWRWSYLGEGQEIHRESRQSGQRFYTHGSGVDEHLSVSWSDSSGSHSNYYVANALGSIRQVVDGNGQTVNQYRYTAFGKMKQVQEAIDNTYTYTGREWDADAGLYYYRARWYDPDVGRFMSEDPIGLKGGDANVFKYVGNNPINSIDPLGEAVYTCERPLANVPASSFIWQYLHLGHQFLWVESMTPRGYGLAPAEGYGILSTTMKNVPGRIEREPTRDQRSCELITVDPCWEARIKKVIEEELTKTHTYNLATHNCYHWVREDVLWKSWQ
jgi:RHS repeat-associated protein